MTASATPTKIQVPNDLGEYSRFVSHLLANKTHQEVVPQAVLLFLMQRELKSSKDLDLAKKGLFYGKDHQELERLRTFLQTSAAMQEYRKDIVPLLHSILGLRTEADELLALVVDMLEMACPDLDQNTYVRDKVIDEGGDVLFYLQAALNAVGSSIEEAMQKNRRKLVTRFPNGFTEQQAINPNKQAESKAQSQDRIYSQPQCTFVYCPNTELCRDDPAQCVNPR